jgi:CheY-like chemotaxis protein
VAVVGDGQALVDAEAHVSPDAIVTDISMPVLDGIEAARTILSRNPSARVVFVTVYADPLVMRRGLAVGALGVSRRGTRAGCLGGTPWRTVGLSGA